MSDYSRQLVRIMLTCRSPNQNISQTERLQAWISFAYHERTGPYLSVYYYSAERPPWGSDQVK